METKPYPFPFGAVDMDCIDLAGLRPGGCDADGIRDAFGRDASRVGEAVSDVGALLAAVGAGDSAHHAPGTAVSAGEARLHRGLACAYRRLRCDCARVCRVACVAGFSSQPLCVCVGPGRFGYLLFDKFYSGVLSSLLLYAGILAVQYVLDFGARLAYQQTETARLNEQLAKAQLDALRRQIEPHFLFNTLNAVTGLVREGRNETAVSMIAELSDFMRRVLEDSTRQEVPLGEEMEFAQKYLEIQKVRFVERLQLSVDVPSELLLAQVPTLILQPMVENAIKHGIAKRAQGGAVRIAASRSDGTLTLAVYNDGPGLPASWETSQPGIGISNMRTRLRSLYGDAFKLKLENQAPGGVEVSVSVPFKE